MLFLICSRFFAYEQVLSDVDTLEEGAVDSEQKVFLFVDPEIQQLLADNRTDLPTLLKDEGLQFHTGYTQDPAVSDTGKKDIVTTLLATSAVIASLTPTLSRIIEA